METNWANEFYKMQYEFIGDYPEGYHTESANEILEQIGKKVHSMLELGAWDGSLARALSKHVNKITTVELIKEMAEKAEFLNPDNIETIHGSFYDVQLTKKFDAIIYIDGFGVGTDDDQLKLLRNIKHWMEDDGCALIDIYQPEHWKKADGVEMYLDPENMPHIKRRYSYDFEENIMTDNWWHEKNEKLNNTQYLKCYTPDEIYNLCKQAGLNITGYFPHGAMDYESMKYHEHASLEECLSYRIKVVK